jgi:hypothetical protein
MPFTQTPPAFTWGNLNNTWGNLYPLWSGFGIIETFNTIFDGLTFTDFALIPLKQL